VRGSLLVPWVRDSCPIRGDFIPGCFVGSASRTGSTRAPRLLASRANPLARLARNLGPRGLGLVFLLSCTRTPKAPVMPPPEKASAPVTATASVDRARISTEEPVTFSVAVNQDKAVQIRIPDVGGRITGFRITDFGTEEKEEEANRKLIRKWFSLRADVSGSYVLPEVEISYTHEGQAKAVRTSEIFVEVKAPSVDPAQPGEELRDIKALEKSPGPALGWLLGCLGVLAAVMGIALYARRRRRGPQVPGLPPHVVALNRLDGLSLPTGSDPIYLKHFYFELSEIVRSYVEGRYGFRATDMTHEEIVRNIKQDASFPEGERPAFLDLLKETEIVKFTDHQPGPEATVTAKERAKNFVVKTRPADELPETESVV